MTPWGTAKGREPQDQPVRTQRAPTDPLEGVGCLRADQLVVIISGCFQGRNNLFSWWQSFVGVSPSSRQRHPVCDNSGYSRRSWSPTVEPLT
jgi:hypothetical protein